MKFKEVSLENLETLYELIPGQTPFIILNLLRYNTVAEYQKADLYPKCSGREAYHERYVPAFIEVTGGKNFEFFFGGHVIGNLIGPTEEKWDEILMVKYPSIEYFRELAKNKAYFERANPHRLAAVSDTRLIAMLEMDRN